MTAPGSLLRATIESEPKEVSRLLAERAGVAEAAGAIADARRVFLVGTGTSYHGCLVGEHLLRSVGLEARAMLSFEFAAYPPVTRRGDVIILLSHRGTKRFTLAAAGRAGSAATVVITGEGSEMPGSVVLRTVAQEGSPVHTASHLGALVRLAQIVGELAPGGEVASSLNSLPEAVRVASATAEQCREVVAGLDLNRPVHFAGAGPGWATALEGALKIREAAFITAEGHELEGLLHGPLISIDRSDSMIMIAQPGPSIERAREAGRALLEIGTPVIAVGAAASTFEAAGWKIETPLLPEVMSPLVNVIPLQWLAYHASMARSVDADSFRRGDPAYLAAQAHFTL